MIIINNILLLFSLNLIGMNIFNVFVKRNIRTIHYWSHLITVLLNVIFNVSFKSKINSHTYRPTGLDFRQI